MPVEALEVGDWLRFTHMGDYYTSSATEFNGFKFSKVRYTVDPKGDESVAKHLQELLGEWSSQT